MNHRPWRETAEYLLLAGSGIGVVASAISQQFFVAAAPLSGLVLLGLLNRRHFDEQTEQKTAIALNQFDHRFSKDLASLRHQLQGAPQFPDLDKMQQAMLQKQQESLQQLTQDLRHLHREIEQQLAPLQQSDVPNLRQDFEQMRAQHTQLLTDFEKLAVYLPQLVTSDRLDSATAAVNQLQTEVARLQTEVRRLSDEPTLQLKALQEQISHLNRRINQLPTPFDASSLKQDVDSLIRIMAGLVPRREFAQLLVRVENLNQEHYVLEQAIAPARLAMTVFKKQLATLQKQVVGSGDAVLLADLRQSVTTLEQRLAQLPTLPQLNDLQAAQTNLSADVATLRQQVNVVEQSTQDLQQQQKALRDWVYRLPQLLDNSALQTQLQHLANRVESVDSRVTDVRSAVEAVVQQHLETLQPQCPTPASATPYEFVFALQPQLQRRDRPEAFPGSRAFLQELLAQAQSQLIVVWPWPDPFGLDATLLREFRAFLNRGGRVALGWGHLGATHQSYAPRYVSPRLPLATCEKNWLHDTLRQLTELKREFPQQFKFKVLGTEENFVVCDRSLAVLKVPNLPVSNTVFPDLELGLRTSDPQVIQGLIDRFDQPTLDHEDATAYFNRAATRYEIGDKTGAIADYTQVLAIDSHNDVAYNNRGVARYDLGERTPAIADFDQAIQYNPDSAVAYCNRGYIRAELGDKLGAIEDYSQALKLHPEDATTYFHRGLARTRIGNKLGAIEDYSHAIWLQPEDATAYFYRGLARTKLGDKQGAIADLQKAAKIFGDRGDQVNYRKARNAIRKLKQSRLGTDLISC